MSSGSDMRPGPNSPQAMSPSSGPITVTPRDFNVSILAWVAACCHMRTFMAGATITGLSVASSAVVARSVASPPAILASTSAEAGATRITSASRLS